MGWHSSGGASRSARSVAQSVERLHAQASPPLRRAARGRCPTGRSRAGCGELGRRSAERKDALQRRPLRPLPRRWELAQAAHRNNVGLAQGWQKQGGGTEWTPTKVPNAWNAGDDSLTSYLGSVGWYRNDLRLPAGAPDRSWVIRFEQVNYSATVWLNGVQIGSHSGAHEPFELRLPKAIVKTGAANSLVLGSTVDARSTICRHLAITNLASRKVAGGTTPASCARFTCAQSIRSTSLRSTCAPICLAQAALPSSTGK